MVDRRIQQTLICSLRVTEFISEKDHQVEKTIDRHKISSYPWSVSWPQNCLLVIQRRKQWSKWLSILYFAWKPAAVTLSKVWSIHLSWLGLMEHRTFVICKYFELWVSTIGTKFPASWVRPWRTWSRRKNQKLAIWISPRNRSFLGEILKILGLLYEGLSWSSNSTVSHAGQDRTGPPSVIIQC